MKSKLENALFLSGGAAVVAGFALIYRPLGFIVGGLFLMAILILTRISK